MSSKVDAQNKDSAKDQVADSKPEQIQDKAAEYGEPKGKEPTRYGDWEKNGRCIDF
jgi:hypothetical protein